MARVQLSPSVDAIEPPSGVRLLPPGDLPVRIDWHAVASYLAGHGLTLDLGFAPRRFAGGLANINLLIRLDSDWAVFRRPPAGPLPLGAHDMAREHRVLSRLWRHLPLAPRSLHFSADVAVAGAPFQILAFVPGRIVHGDTLAPLPSTPEAGRAVSELLIDTLAGIHAVDTDAAGLADLGRPAGFLARSAAGWIARVGVVLGDHKTPSCSFLIDWLERTSHVEAAHPTLLHSDFKLDNIILAEDSITPAAVVDWDMATRGDPLFDLATLLSYWAEPDDPPCMHRLAQMPTALPGFLTREQAACSYAERTGRSLDGFLFPRVLALFKLCVVFHQLHRRYANEGTNDPRLMGFAALADALFDFAADVARGGRF